MNVLTEDGIRELDVAIDAALANEDVKGIVITSGKPDFAGGMDLAVIAGMKEAAGDDPARGLFEGIMAMHGLLRKIERAGMDPKTLKGGKPVAWAAPGLSAGIGTEIGLACHRRFLADTPKAKVGLPEILVGLFPGAGGTTRVSRMLGLMELAALLRAASWALLCMFFAAPVLRHPATVIGLLSIVALQGVTLLVTTFSRRAMLASLAVFWAACVGRMAMLHDPRWVQIALVGLVYQAVLAHFGLALHRQVTTSVRDELITDGLLRRVSLLHQRVRAQRDELAAVNQRLSDALQLSTELATRDHLTGVLNRRAFQTNLDNWISSVNGGRPAALLLIDFDHFKLVNDRHGHAVGDAVLRDCAAVLGGALRDGDVLARWGGEEFIALLPDTDLPAAEHLAQSARQAIAERIRMAPDWGTTVTVSVGVAVIDRQVGFDAAFAAADDALYLAKALGRDRVQVSTAGR